MSLEETPGYGCGAGDSESVICDCLSCSIERIASATESIAVSLADRSEDACKNIDQCTDKILENIKKKIEGPLYSCEKCKSMVAGGLAGTLEYAVRCAGVSCDDCVESCSSEGEPINEGKCCRNCQGENCTCRGGGCSPGEPDEEEKEFRYVAWCHLETNTIAVTRTDQPPPGPGYSQVGLTDTEQAAVEIAKANCFDKSDESEGKPPVQPAGSTAVVCDIESYFNGIAANLLNVKAVSANLAAGSAQAHEAIAALGFAGFNAGTIGGAIGGLVKSATGSDGILLTDLTPLVASSLGCSESQFSETFKAVASISQVCRYLGVDPTPYLAQHFYAMNAVCRQVQLTPNQAMAAFLSDETDSFPLDKHYAIAGVCNEAMQWQIKSSRSKLIPLELVTARRRRMIDQEEYRKGIRKLGYIGETEAETIFKLSEQVTTPQELIRYMVRDAGNKGVVDTFGLDTGFTDNFSGEIKDWSEFQGVTDKQMQYNWRAQIGRAHV